MSVIGNPITLGGGSGENYIVDNAEIDNLTVSGNGYTVQEFSCTKQGYAAVGIVGFYCVTASSSGTGVSYINVRTVNLIESGTKVQFSLRNANSSAAKIKIGAQVLYKES